MNKDKKAKDKTRNNIFAAAFDHLRRTTDIKTQQELADRMGVAKETVSRIITAKTKVTDDAITKLQTACGCIFNLQWLRGESDVMLAADADKAPAVRNQHQSTQLQDYGSMTNAIIAAKDDAIESLKRELVKTEEFSKHELAAKEKTISALRSEMATKDAYIKTLQQQVADLHATIALLQTKGDFGNYPFTIGAADEGRKAQV